MPHHVHAAKRECAVNNRAVIPSAARDLTQAHSVIAGHRVGDPGREVRSR
jgi:hypothetical protein